MNSKDNILNTSQLCLYGDFDSQVNQLMQIVRLSKAEVDNIPQLFNDLEKTLSRRWPGCKVFPFGSIVTGLGIKTSDVDCYVSLPDHLQVPGETYVKQAKNLLNRNPVFQQLFAIFQAKVPILKFYHVPTGRYCDLSFKGPSGVRNSELIAYLLGRDRRALTLCVLIKYWSKVHNFTGTNLMPNYALTLLVIFYLQQVDILPPVSELQRHTDVLIINEWDTSFDHIDYEQSNTDSLFDLLEGFFNYYDAFNFEENIISPFLGCPIKRKDFVKIQDVPLEFGLYKMNVNKKICPQLNINTPMCVQDPFEHSRNCTVAVYPRLVVKIKSCFQLAAKTFNEYSSEVCLRNLLIMKVPNLETKRPKEPVCIPGKVQKKAKKKPNKQKLKTNLISLFEMYNNIKKQKRC